MMSESMNEINFTNGRIKNEFDQLKDKNLNLYNLIHDIAEYLYSIDKEYVLTLTHLFRTSEDHVRIYRHISPSKRPKSSPHMYWGDQGI